MVLYVSGSYPANQEGIAAGAKVLLDSFRRVCDKDKFVLLTTDIDIIRNFVELNENGKTEFLKNWKVRPSNIKKLYSILGKYDINVVHMEYPGDCYGKTFLASFLPLLVKIYNWKNHKKLKIHVRLHEFSRARFLRKVAILPILLFADSIYVPAQHDRNIVSRIAGKRVKKAIIGTNIAVCDAAYNKSDDSVVVSYFGGVYPGKGIERMFQIWKSVKELDDCNRIRFKIIGEVNSKNGNHFSEYHKKVEVWLQENNLTDCVDITGYVTDDEVSKEIQSSDIATLLYEDGLTLRRGSFIAYLTHGTPIVTTMPDEEANELLTGHEGVAMCASDKEICMEIFKYSKMSKLMIEEIKKDNQNLAKYFNWDTIAESLLNDYGVQLH